MENLINQVTTHHAVELIMNKLTSWFDLIVSMLPNIALASLIMVAFFGISYLVRKGVSKMAHRISSNSSLNRLLATVLQIATLTVGLFLALNILHLDKTVTSILAGVGVIGLALGFAFQETAANFISGVFLAVKRPFKVGDIIKAQDFMGTVEKIGLRTTQIKTFQGQIVIVPNKKLFQGIIENFSTLGTRRVDLEVGVSYGVDLEYIEKLTSETLDKLSAKIPNKPVEFFYTGFGDSSINYSVRFWIEYPDEPGFLRARSEAIKSIKKAYDENNITIPFPIRTLDFGIKGGRPLSKEVSFLENMLN